MKIGVFDSGVGGLTVLRAIRKRFSRVDIYYLGDTARVPYGTKSPETVIRYSLECAEFLSERSIDVLVVACNTASSYALDTLRATLSVPVIGVVEPGVTKALSCTRGIVGVIGTSATIKSNAYQSRLKAAGVEVYSKACPLFVPLVEEGLLEGEITQRVIEMYLKEFKDIGIDTLILGCTHYPLLKGAIQEFLGNVEVVDSSDAVAEELSCIVRDEGNAKTELFFTDMSQNLENLIEVILGNKLQPKILKEWAHRA
ncbi:glutamate racemase [Hydrogenivirga caldilitoris]|uniref:Glutamate racemase n=1 Tax=Hydrogenivirga caldilitoris TaxID=246264 RepID=A0A497XT01_9AQUI|nr:glutamate racemase [Hydrogenivirga caldilitoris]RLJ71300.1 glutamate racemase [Hydrogenivirga caldilitoris]